MSASAFTKLARLYVPPPVTVIDPVPLPPRMPPLPNSATSVADTDSPSGRSVRSPVVVGPVFVQVVPEHVVCVSTSCPLSVFVWDVPSMSVVCVTVQFPVVVQSPWMTFVWLVPVSLSCLEFWLITNVLHEGTQFSLPVWTESPAPFRIGPNCVCVNEYPGGSSAAVWQVEVNSVWASSHCVSVCVACAVETSRLSWFTLARIPPLAELWVWFTGPTGVFAIAVSVFVWLNLALFAPVAIPKKPALWFCVMSSATFGPVSTEFWFWVIPAVPVAVDVSV